MNKKIIGNPVTTPYPRPDWDQTDETKADFIKNKRDSYKYYEVDNNDFFRILELETNTVTYICGEPPESGEIEFNFISNANGNTTEEVVIILDFYNSGNIPTIQFNAFIRWLNGEPPTIEVGKTYIFSFIRAKSAGGLVYKYLGIGGEFA